MQRPPRAPLVACETWRGTGGSSQLMTFCPISGRNLSGDGSGAHHRAVPDPVLVSHVVDTTSLAPGEAARVIEDVIAFHAQPVEVFVRERHARLKTYGAKNPEIFALIAEELAERVVAAPVLSERQLRRIIYG